MDGNKTKRVGIMGGTFDPIHYGHLLIAQSAADEFQLDQVIFMPTGKSPHKPESQVTPSKQRYIMVQKAISDNPKFRLSDLEVHNTETNYTYLTLEKLAVDAPDTHFYFIMGGDSLRDFSGWKNPKRICELATILAAVRDDMDGAEIEEEIGRIKKQYYADIYMLHSPNFSVSSQNIRERIQNNRSIRYLVPGIVEKYITQEGLYLNKG